jgi:hypothetical protein
MMSSFRLTIHAVATLFVVFDTSPIYADRASGHVIILADMSDSMFGWLPDPVTFQTRGILNGIAAYQLHCSEIRVTYVPWGTDIGAVINGNVSDSAELLHAIEQASRTELGDTRHFAAWSSASHLFKPTEPTAVVILTNGSGRRTVTKPVPHATIYKVAVQSERAYSYLNNEFLPGVGETIFANDVDTITRAINAALRSVDTLCLS